MRNLRLQAALGMAAILAAPAEAYYHYTHYLNGNTPIYEKFDLNALPAKTLTFFVVDGGPATYGPNDDFASVLSQVKQAAIAWNSVDSSDLRVAFGGLESQAQSGATAGGDVIFADLPPGVLGIGGVTPASTPINDSNGRPFFPVVRSTILLTNNTSQAPGPSYLEGFFTTAVHEMGHALGLQHTWTSAAMSQDVIRNTSRVRPLDADDRAGLSVLYGKANWTAAYGSISGRVTANGQGVALASVVAIPPIGPAISALTNPDGTYTINGLPASSYLLYVHPLPPDAVVANNLGLRLPVDQNNQTLQPFGSAFRTFFQPDRINPQQPASFTVSPGTNIAGQNFAVTLLQRDDVRMYDMVTYSYNQARTASTTPAYVNVSSGQITVVAQANYGTTPIPQSVTILGGFSTATPCGAVPCFSPYSNALAVYLNVPLGVTNGPRHMVFTLPNGDIYVLPDAVNLVQRNAPAISSISSNADGTVTVSGSGFGNDSTVYFDGQPATIQNNDGRASITVMPPPGYGGQTASVIVFNSDGQNSTFYQSQNPPTYAYASSAAPQITVSTPSLPANASSLIEINAANMQFSEGLVTVGFGTSDISVRRVWVLNPTRLVANVAVAPNAAIGLSEVSVLAGFQIASQSNAFQTQTASPSQPAIALPITNADPNQPIIYPGAVVTVSGTNLGNSAGSVQVTLNEQSVPVVLASPTQISFTIPSGFPAGMAVLKLNNGSSTSLPVQLQIEGAPPVIQQVTNAAGPLDTRNTAVTGDVLVAVVTGVDPSVVTNQSRVQVTASGVPMPVLRIAAGPQREAVLVSFLINQSFGGSTASIIVSVDNVRSSPYSVLVR
ncbi:MAG: hypothetical protein C5B51_04535 [Terriglobia bacterium]|nr:MAG: hypothetical protein C5B51_04535 [Terriglobia bacterium]